jgi:hypothetical protein
LPYSLSHQSLLLMRNIMFICTFSFFFGTRTPWWGQTVDKIPAHTTPLLCQTQGFLKVLVNGLHCSLFFLVLAFLLNSFLPFSFHFLPLLPFLPIPL